MLYILLLIFAIKNSFADNPSFFSGKITTDHFLTLIVNGDKAIIRKLNLNQEYANIEYGENGKAYIVQKTEPIQLDENGQQITKQPIKPENNNASYQYFLPKDACYMLTNLYKVCTNKGKVITVIKYNDKISAESDPFFSENNDECNIFKFNIAYHIFVLQKSVESEQYQIAINGYPDFIKAVIVDYEQVLKNIKVKDLNKSNNLRAFFVASNNDIGCIPYKKLKLYSDGEAQIYKMHIDKYRLVGQAIKNDDVFVEIENSRIKSKARLL